MTRSSVQSSLILESSGTQRRRSTHPLIASAVHGNSIRSWFAHRMADKYSRNKSHGDLIARLATLVKSGVTNEHASECREWELWVLVRNSIVHLGGIVSSNLAAAWPAKYGSEGTPIALSDKDVMRAAHVSRVIARALDRRLVQVIIHDHDQALMAQEIFIRTGESNPKKLSALVSKRLGTNMKPSRAAEAVAAQKRGDVVEHGFSFVDEMLPV